MKSIYICFGMIVASFFIFVSYSWYIQYDHMQNLTEIAVKRSLKATMVDYVDKDDFEAEDVLKTFEKYLKEQAIEDAHYSLTLNGFMREPLFMRVHCIVESEETLGHFKIEVDEAMIEELKENE